MNEVWPWLTFAGFGAFHGLNPAMGWLFAVALGLHRQSRAIVAASLIPIAIGHAASVAVVACLLVIAGYLVPSSVVRIGSGLLLLGWPRITGALVIAIASVLACRWGFGDWRPGRS
jgi:hypothetical protein